MIVKIALAFRYRWPHEFSELFTLVRARFIRNLYKYAVGGPYYFRFFMRKAVWFDVRDVVFKERRQMGLQKWTDKQTILPTHKDGEECEVSLGYWIRPDNPADELSDQLDLSDALLWLGKTTKVSELDKAAFQLITNGVSPQQALIALDAPPQYSVMAATLRVRSALCEYLTGKPLYIGWISAARCEAPELIRIGIKLGPYNAKPKPPIIPRFERCEATDEALSRLQPFDSKFLWHFDAVNTLPATPSSNPTAIDARLWYVVEFSEDGKKVVRIMPEQHKSEGTALAAIPKGIKQRDRFCASAGRFLIDRGIHQLT